MKEGTKESLKERKKDIKKESLQVNTVRVEEIPTRRTQVGDKYQNTTDTEYVFCPVN